MTTENCYMAKWLAFKRSETEDGGEIQLYAIEFFGRMLLKLSHVT